MGRGDKRTKRGKRTLGSYGKSRIARPLQEAKMLAKKKA